MGSSVSIPFLDNAAPAASAGQNTTVPTGGDIEQLVGQANAATMPTAPQYTATTTATVPHVTQPNYKPMQNDNVQPLSNTRHGEKLAERKSNLREVTNAINSYSNKKEKEKYDRLTQNIQDVVNAQGQIANAQQALQNNPNDAAAKEVLEKNKQFLDAKLSDDKIRKEMAKAFDVSFVDPSKNNTPEVKAGQEAMKRAAEAQKSGVNHNTPQEKAVAESLNKTPEQQKQQQQDNQPQQSKTPYADQFLKSRPEALTQNPLYSQQLAMAQKQQQLMTQYVVPKLLQSVTAQKLQEIKEGGANARATYKEEAAFARQQNALATQVKLGNQRASTALQQTAMRNSALMARTQAMIQARKELASNPKYSKIPKEITDMKVLTEINSSIAKLTQSNTQLQNQSILAGTDEDSKKAIAQAIKMNNASIEQMQRYSNEVQTKNLGTEQAPTLTGVKSGNPSDITTTDDDSDSDDEDSIIDNSSFGEGSGFSIENQ